MKEKIKRHSIAIFICFIFAFICFFSVSGFNLANLKYSGDSITSDEVPHITSGYYYLKSGRYFLNPEHPPLVKDISALLTRLILNPDFPKVSAEAPYPQESEKENLFFNENIFPRSLEIENYHWDNRMLIFNPKNNPDLIILLSRLPVITFNSIFLFILYLLLEKSWDKRSALISIFLIAASQFSISHASIVTTDFAASILSISALAAFSVYIKKFFRNENNITWMVLSILFFALAFISKFSTFILIPATFLGGLVYCVFVVKNLKKILAYTERFAAMIILSLLLVFSFYSFHVINSDADGIKSQLQQNYPSKLPSYGKEFLTKMAEGNRFGKAVAAYGVGLSMTINRIDSAGQATYFMGKIYGSEGVGHRYFPILYLTKLPLPFHILTVLSFLLFLIFLRKRILKKELRLKLSGLGLLLFVFIVIYSYESISSNLNIGLRHFTPVVFAVSVLTARGASLFWNEKIFKKIKMVHATFILLTMMFISIIISFPRYLSYYNILAGGTDNGYKIATDSNYDWGQDIKRLGRWTRDNNVEKIYVHIFSANKLDYYLNDKQQWFNIEYDDLPPSGSYLAVSAQELQNNIYNPNLHEDKKYSRLKDDLVARAGKSIFIFKIP